MTNEQVALLLQGIANELEAAARVIHFHQEDLTLSNIEDITTKPLRELSSPVADKLILDLIDSLRARARLLGKGMP